MPASFSRSETAQATARPPGWTILLPSSIWSSGKSVTHSSDVKVFIAFRSVDLRNGRRPPDSPGRAVHFKSEDPAVPASAAISSGEKVDRRTEAGFPLRSDYAREITRRGQWLRRPIRDRARSIV